MLSANPQAIKASENDRCLSGRGSSPRASPTAARCTWRGIRPVSSVLDHTGNLKAVQKLLGHSSITTTGYIYTDWDIDQLEETMRVVVGEDDDADDL